MLTDRKKLKVRRLARNDEATQHYSSTPREAFRAVQLTGRRFEHEFDCGRLFHAASEHGALCGYPILANAEIAEQLGARLELGHAPDWADKVHFVEGYSQAGVDAMTAQTRGGRCDAAPTRPSVRDGYLRIS